MRTTFLAIVIIISAIGQARADSEAFYNDLFSECIRMGSTPEEVQRCRPTAQISRLTELLRGTIDADSILVLTDLVMDDISAPGRAYYFVDGELEAMAYSNCNLSEGDISEPRKIRSFLNRDFIKRTTDRVPRLDVDGETFFITVELWQEKNSDIRVYFLSTNYETSVIVFDPRYVGKGTFFSTRRLKSDDPERSLEESTIIDHLAPGGALYVEQHE